MESDLYAYEPRGCVTLRLAEIDELLMALGTYYAHPMASKTQRKLCAMRAGILLSAQLTVPAFLADWEGRQ